MTPDSLLRSRVHASHAAGHELRHGIIPSPNVSLSQEEVCHPRQLASWLDANQRASYYSQHLRHYHSRIGRSRWQLLARIARGVSCILTFTPRRIGASLPQNLAPMWLAVTPKSESAIFNIRGTVQRPCFWLLGAFWVHFRVVHRTWRQLGATPPQVGPAPKSAPNCLGPNRRYVYLARRKGAVRVEVRGDWKLVINQMGYGWACRKLPLIRLQRVARS